MSKIKKLFYIEESTVEKLEALKTKRGVKHSSELLAQIIDEVYNDEISGVELGEKLDRILTAINQVSRMSYHTRDALNSLIYFYLPDTGFRSADGDLTSSDPHEYIRSSEENYKAKLSAATIHKRGIEKNRKERNK